MSPTRRDKEEKQSGETDYRSDPWDVVNTLRGGMYAADYKQIARGLMFLKIIVDAFKGRHAEVFANWVVSPLKTCGWTTSGSWW